MVIRELEWVRNLYLGFILSVFPLLISMLTCFICAYIINLHSSSYKSRTEVQEYSELLASHVFNIHSSQKYIILESTNSDNSGEKFYAPFRK